MNIEKINKIIDSSVDAFYDAIIVNKTVTTPDSIVSIVQLLLNIVAYNENAWDKEEIKKMFEEFMDKIECKMISPVDRVTIKEEI